MRVIVFVRSTKDAEAGVMPSAELLESMGAYNEALAKAGIMRDGGGLRPTSYGVRVRFDGDSRTVPEWAFRAYFGLGGWILDMGS